VSDNASVASSEDVNAELNLIRHEIKRLDIIVVSFWLELLSAGLLDREKFSGYIT
jgi:hypothetical protein